jgi:calcineurin-like phosphoesterase family protein
MDEAIIENWNSCVSPKDRVYFLGDFSFYRDYEKDTEILSRLNGREKYLIKGNHDYSKKIKKVEGWTWVKDYYELILDGLKIVLFHFPIQDWNGAFHGSWHFHGHQHNTKPHTGVNRIDVGVDAWDYYPTCYDIIKEYREST